jgi:hypothetical protein
MRLKSDIFVAALIRRVFASGDFAAVEKRGAEEAGAIFIRQRFRDGSETLYGPAPQVFSDSEESDTGRRFEVRLLRQDAAEVAAVIEKESRFDRDLWLVEIETENAGDLFTVVTGDI